MCSSLLIHIRKRSSAVLAVRQQSFLSRPRHYLHQQVERKRSTAIQPALRKARKDGSDEEIEEEELYRYTRYRWLFSEPEKLAVRYRKFNLQALLDAAVNSAGNGAKSCVKVLKCVEGQFNKAFLLTMDNQFEVFAKIPNPNAGPNFFTTASEVATRHFLREVLGLPIPRIYASSSDPSNAVGAEYIIEEKACGQPLGTLWDQWSIESRLDMVSQIVDLERKLTSISFPKHGCIYYKTDLDGKGLDTEDLTTELVTTDSLTTKLDPSIIKRFTLGPSTDARFWERERAKMCLDRGPWYDTLEYIKALGSNEIKHIKSYAKPRMNFHRSMKIPESPNDFLILLSRYMTLAPYLVPATSNGVLARTLSHPDLHLDNLFVDADTGKITNIIDWQSTSVCEMFLQRAVPPIFSHPNLCSFDQTTEGEPERHGTNKAEKELTDVLRHYEQLTKGCNPRRWAAWRQDYIPILTKPVSLVCSAWNQEDVFSFRHALLSVIVHWEKIAPEIPCPVQFTERELQLHQDEMELLEGLGTIMHQLQDENLVPLGGMVLSENYEQAQHINDQVREMFISLAENEEQRILCSKIWPYQDG
ncbi:MAG: Phosphotransferase enzyme [Sclerophora amabilis]|nr:MAG: Phosphotransferase enzyme [Sclerophora amabilis]